MRPPQLRALILVLGHAVLIQTLTYAMRPTLSYAVLEAGASPALLGSISATFALPGLLLALPIGHALDRFGERTALVAGTLAVGSAAALVVLEHSSIVLLIVATVLFGLGHLMSLIGQQAMLANTVARGRSDSVFGLYTFAASLGQTLGPFLLLLPGGTSTAPPIHLVFLACGLISIVMLALAAFAKSSPKQADTSQPKMLRTAGVLLRIPGLPHSLVATSVVMASIDIFLVYLPALGHERGVAVGLISAMLVARSVASMLSRLFLGPLVRLVGRRRLLVTAVALSAASLVAFALPLAPAWLVVLSAVYGFVVGTCQPITMSIISDLAPPGTRGLAMSLRLGGNRIGQTVVPAVLGAAAVITGAGGVLAATGVLLGAAAWVSTGVRDSAASDEMPPGPGTEAE